nr:hypothetical protein [Staphylococcus aureus]
MGDLAKPDISRDLVFFDVGAKILLVSQKCDTFLMRKVGVILANKELKIRNVDSELLDLIKRIS